MNKLGFALGAFILIVWFINSNDEETQSLCQPGTVFRSALGAEMQPIFGYQVVQIEKLKKGGSIEPLVEPRYTLIVARALVDDQETYDKVTIRNTAQKIVLELIQAHKPDGITVKLFNSTQNLKSNSSWIAESEWWPKGHSFNPLNKAYIEAKECHEFEVKYSLPTQVKSEKIVSEFSLEDRKRIYIRIYQGEIQAHREAERRFPLETPDQTSESLAEYLAEADRLIDKHEVLIMSEYKLSPERLDLITQEGIDRNWPTDN